MAINIVNKSKRSATLGGSSAAITISSEGTILDRLYLLSLGSTVSAIPSNGEGVNWNYINTLSADIINQNFKVMLYQGICTSAGTGNWSVSGGSPFRQYFYILDEAEGVETSAPVVQNVKASGRISGAGNTRLSANLAAFGASTNRPYVFLIGANPTTFFPETGFTTVMGPWTTSGLSFQRDIQTIYASASSDTTISIPVSGNFGSDAFFIALELKAAIEVLGVQTSEYGYQAGSLALTQVHSLPVTSSEYGYEAGSVSLVSALIVVNSKYGYQAASVDIDQLNNLTINSAEYAFEANTVQLIRNIITNGAEFGFETGSPNILHVFQITPQASEYGHEIGSLALQKNIIVVNGEFAFEATSTDITQIFNIAPGFNKYGIEIGSAALVQQHILNIINSEYGWEATSTGLRFFKHGQTPTDRIKTVVEPNTFTGDR